MIKYFPKLWWTLLFIFLLHQLCEKIFHWHFPFFDNYLDAFLAMPLLLGLHLVERRYFFRQGADFSIPILETVIITIFFAFIFEECFPLWREGFVRDPWDYLCYGLGALSFHLFLNKPEQLIRN